jgi:hypothetical protein
VLEQTGLVVLDRPVKPGDDHRERALDIRGALPLAAPGRRHIDHIHMNIIASP